MDFSIDVIKITREVFGLSGYLPSVTDKLDGAKYEIPSNNNERSSINFPDSIQKIDLDSVVEKSVFGTPIYDVVYFKNSDGSDRLKLNDAPLVTINRAKTVIRTPVAGRDGTVKEIISNDDYQISIRGILVNHTKRAKPYEDFEKLLAMLNENKNHPVTSKLFNKCGITDLVVTGFDFPPVEGYINVMAYSITAYSDEPEEFKLNL